MKINEKTRNILIFASVFIGICIITLAGCYLHDILFAHTSLYYPKLSNTEIANYNSLKNLLFIVYFLLHYFPTILILILIFKKVTNINKRIWSIAFAFPVTNLIYSIIHLCISNLSIYNANLWYQLWYTKIYMNTIGFTTYIFNLLLFVFLPVTLFTALVIPEKYLPIKKEICKTTILTFLISILPFILAILILTILKLFGI